MAKEKIYELSYGWYEENITYSFTHANNKLQAEFEQDCYDIIHKYIDEHIEKGGAVQDRDFKSWIGHDTIIQMAAEKLPELGYVPFSDTFTIIPFTLCGSTIIDEDGDGTEIVKIIGEENLQKIITYNKALEESL
jgi:hypothetical protein